MMVFFFFLCLQYAIVANIERVSYEEVRIHFAEIFIYFFSIVQLFTSAYWLTELIVCNIILLVTCYGMLYHMYHPQNEEEKEAFINKEYIMRDALMVWISFFFFSLINRIFIEKRERTLFMAKTVS